MGCEMFTFTMFPVVIAVIVPSASVRRTRSGTGSGWLRPPHEWVNCGDYRVGYLLDWRFETGSRTVDRARASYETIARITKEQISCR